MRIPRKNISKTFLKGEKGTCNMEVMSKLVFFGFLRSFKKYLETHTARIPLWFDCQRKLSGSKVVHVMGEIGHKMARNIKSKKFGGMLMCSSNMETILVIIP